MTAAGDYNPYERGSHPVGVRTAQWHDAQRGRTLPVEIYFPATSEFSGQDLDPKTQDAFGSPDGSMAGETSRRQSAVRDASAQRGEFPLILFSHGYSGDRREFTNLCTHLASHGYRVVSADHVGSTFADVQVHMQQPRFDRRATLPQMCRDRLGDVPFLLSAAEREFGTALPRVGVTGASFGGWTSLIAPSVDARVRAIAPMCPGGSDGPLAAGGINPLRDHFSFDWKAPAAVMTLVGDSDTWLPLPGQLQLFARVPVEDKRIVVLVRADHNHFVDEMERSHDWYRAFTKDLAEHDSDPTLPWGAIAKLIRPFGELMPEREALSILYGAITQHMDTHLKDLAAARELGAHLAADMARRHLHAYELRFA